MEGSWNPFSDPLQVCHRRTRLSSNYEPGHPHRHLELSAPHLNQHSRAGSASAFSGSTIGRTACRQACWFWRHAPVVTQISRSTPAFTRHIGKNWQGVEDLKEKNAAAQTVVRFSPQRLWRQHFEHCPDCLLRLYYHYHHQASGRGYSP